MEFLNLITSGFAYTFQHHWKESRRKFINDSLSCISLGHDVAVGVWGRPPRRDVFLPTPLRKRFFKKITPQWPCFPEGWASSFCSLPAISLQTVFCFPCRVLTFMEGQGYQMQPLPPHSTEVPAASLISAYVCGICGSLLFWGFPQLVSAEVHFCAVLGTMLPAPLFLWRVRAIRQTPSLWAP